MKIIKVKFKSSNKSYNFDPNGFSFQPNDKVIIDTLKGIEIATVVNVIDDFDKKELIHPLKKIDRKATEKDIKKSLENEKFLEKMLPEVKKLITKYKLDMKVLDCTSTLTRDKITIHFTSDGRVDFRALVRELGAKYKTRIELRQVGERDSAKLTGGIGPCGLTLCCSTFLGSFSTVSIKMAKVQNLSLNPDKLSGVCGKLFCCLKYENDVYVELGKGMPKMGKLTFSPDGVQKVVGLNILKQEITVSNKERERTVFTLEEIVEARKVAEANGENLNQHHQQNNKNMNNKEVNKGNKQKPSNNKEVNKGNKQKPSSNKEVNKGNKQKPSNNKEVNKSNEQKPSNNKEVNKGNKQKPSNNKKVNKANEQKPSNNKEVNKINKPKHNHKNNKKDSNNLKTKDMKNNQNKNNNPKKLTKEVDTNGSN